MWDTYKAAGRPFPKLCESDVIDYMIVEAVSLKAMKEEQKRQKEQQMKEWKKGKPGDKF